jgi:uncharacterized protein
MPARPPEKPTSSNAPSPDPSPCGWLFYVDDRPVAFTLGEELVCGASFVIHFEKALTRNHYRGIYQALNQSFAALLPDQYKTINREQDMGDPGLRQAKQSYAPIAFVKKSPAPAPSK